MANRSVTLISQSYSDESKSFTFLIRFNETGKVKAMAPAELYKNRKIMDKLSLAERDKVAYVAGMQFIEDRNHQIECLKTICTNSKNASKQIVINLTRFTSLDD